MEEVLDAQRPGCIPEYFDMLVPKCHPLFDPECRGDLYIPFLRNRYDFNTGYAPNNPRMQLNEITPWFDGGLMYGPFKAWTDVIRRFQGGELASMDNNEELSQQFPQSNEEIGLPFANPPPPANNSLFPVNRFFSKLQLLCACFSRRVFKNLCCLTLSAAYLLIDALSRFFVQLSEILAETKTLSFSPWACCGSESTTGGPGDSDSFIS